jgi:hypothetical protein
MAAQVYVIPFAALGVSVAGLSAASRTQNAASAVVLVSALAKHKPEASVVVTLGVEESGNAAFEIVTFAFVLLAVVVFATLASVAQARARMAYLPAVLLHEVWAALLSVASVIVPVAIKSAHAVLFFVLVRERPLPFAVQATPQEEAGLQASASAVSASAISALVKSVAVIPAV